MTNISNANEVRNLTLLNLVFQAARDAIEKIKSIDLKAEYAVPTHFGWVNVSYEENGLPNFSEVGWLSGERDFSSFVSVNGGRVKPEQINSYVALSNYGMTDREFQEAVLPNRGNPNDNIFKFIAHHLADSIVERYMHVFSNQEFTPELCKTLYLPLERKIYQRELEIEIIVPIILLDFELDEFQLTDNVRVVKMTNEMQMGRAQTKYSADDGIDRGALSGCTHALVLNNWQIHNEHYWSTASRAESTDIMDRIERFFASVRMVRNVETGYAQLIQYAVGWASSYVANLPEMTFEFVRAYPPSLQKRYLGKNIRPVIYHSEMQEIAKIYSFLMQDEHASLTIAVKRINACYLRSSEDDSIIDATIAMEALFGDNDNQEMTHKLALRMAALSSLDPRHARATIDIFNDTKMIYKFRSKVVHGRKGKEIDKVRFIKHPTGKVSAVEVALTNLRQAIRVFAENPQFLEPELIDKTLLLHNKTISQNDETHA
jgi:Apea-like HEPN